MTRIIGTLFPKELLGNDAHHRDPVSQAEGPGGGWEGGWVRRGRDPLGDTPSL